MPRKSKAAHKTQSESAPQSAVSAKSPDSTKAREAAKLTEPTKAVHAAGPREAKPREPLEAAKPGEPLDVAKPRAPLEAANTLEAATPLEAANTLEAATPLDSVQPLGAANTLEDPTLLESAQPLEAATPPTARSRFNETWIQLSAIAATAMVVFLNSLRNGYHLDDYYRVLNNPGITQISRPWLHFIDPQTMSTLERIAGYRPLLPLSLSIDYAIAGNSVIVHHLQNVALQIGAAWLVYFLALRILEIAPATTTWRFEPARARVLATVVALVFAIHPVSGIPVNYICARDQLISQLLWSGSLLIYLRMHRQGFTFGRWALALGLLFASLLAKGDAVIAPAVIFALNVTVLAQPFRSRRPWLHSILFVTPVVALFVVQLGLFGKSETDHVVARHISMWSYVLTQADVHLFRYLPQFFWPFSIQQDPLIELAKGLTVRNVCGLVFIAGSLFMAWSWRRTQPIWSFCILAYWISLAPTSSVIPLHASAVDYRPYPSSPYLYLGLALAVLHIPRPRPARVRKVLAGIAIVWCALASFVLNNVWRTDATLWAWSVANKPGPLSYLNLAMAASDLRSRRLLLEHALEMAPEYLLVMTNLGRTLVSQGEVEKGLAYLQRAAFKSPRDAQLRYWYGRTLFEMHRYQPAAVQCTIAAELDPRNAATIYQAVIALQAVNDHVAALRLLDVLATLRPREQQLEFARGFSLQQLGRMDEAVTSYRLYLKDHPNHAQARFNVGFALMKRDRCAEAIPELERALALDPRLTAAHLHLAKCARAVGDMTVAQLHQASWEQSQRAKTSR